MLVDEIESESHYNSLETISPPILRSTLPNFYSTRQDRGWTPISLHFTGKQTYRFSSDDSKLIDKFVSNVRTSVHSHNPFKTRHSTDQNNNDEEVVEYKKKTGISLVFFYFIKYIKR